MLESPVLHSNILKIHIKYSGQGLQEFFFFSLKNVADSRGLESGKGVRITECLLLETKGLYLLR